VRVAAVHTSASITMPARATMERREARRVMNRTRRRCVVPAMADSCRLTAVSETSRGMRWTRITASG
jgi:hypothetical protein